MKNNYNINHIYIFQSIIYSVMYLFLYLLSLSPYLFIYLFTTIQTTTIIKVFQIKNKINQPSVYYN